MTVKKESFGTVKQSETALYTLENGQGMRVQVTSFGAAIVSVTLKDKNGTMQDVVLGYDSAEEYASHEGHFGAVVGRCGNRIDKGRFELNGKTYQLAANDNDNNLHSGSDFFGMRIWHTEAVTEDSVTFTLHDADMQQGFPGNMDCRITYTLTEDNTLRLHYGAVCDEDTVANLTNHVYFNLGGQHAGTVEDTVMTIHAAGYTPVRDFKAIPTGEIASVAGTPMDFTSPRVIGKDIDSDFEQLRCVRGYDHNFVIGQDKGEIKTCAEAYSPATGITLICRSDLPGVQFYTGNFIEDGLKGKGGAVYQRRGGFCLETQYFPNSLNQEGFAKPILKAGENFDSVTEYQFSVRSGE